MQGKEPTIQQIVENALQGKVSRRQLDIRILGLDGPGVAGRKGIRVSPLLYNKCRHGRARTG